MKIADLISQLRGQMATKLEARNAHARKLAELRDASTPDETAIEAERAAKVGLDAEIDQIQARVADLEREQAADEAADRLAREVHPGVQKPSSGERTVKVGAEPETYRRGGPHSYFRDLYRAAVNGGGAREAVERLARNDQEVRALSTTDGAGGEFVPPLWMVNEFIELARAGRVVADQVRQESLPTGTDSINLPRLATGTAVAEQATQNTAVQNTDATTNSVTAAVTTIAGQQVVSQQLIDQSPINVDTILLADLAADYAVKLDTFVLTNNAANKIGLLSVSGLNAVTYTDASPTVGELYPKIADGIQQIHTGRLMPAQKIFMHPRRWAWFTAAVDTAGRPLAVPASNMPQNAIAQLGDAVAEGFVGMLQGLPVYVDPNIPINLGAGTNEDRIIIARTDDIVLFEGEPKAETFRETKADQLSVLLRFYNYVALHGSRYPKSISVIAGTGLITPTF